MQTAQERRRATQVSITLTEFETQCFEDMWVLEEGTKRNTVELEAKLEEAEALVDSLSSQLEHWESSVVERRRRITEGLGVAHGVRVPTHVDMPEKAKDGRLILSWSEEKKPKSGPAAKKKAKRKPKGKPRAKRKKAG